MCPVARHLAKQESDTASPSRPCGSDHGEVAAGHSMAHARQMPAANGLHPPPCVQRLRSHSQPEPNRSTARWPAQPPPLWPTKRSTRSTRSTRSKQAGQGERGWQEKQAKAWATPPATIRAGQAEDFSSSNGKPSGTAPRGAGGTRDRDRTRTDRLHSCLTQCGPAKHSSDSTAQKIQRAVQDEPKERRAIAYGVHRREDSACSSLRPRSADPAIR